MRKHDFQWNIFKATQGLLTLESIMEGSKISYEQALHN
jgi:hypothetical protein